jgi:urease accessory protein
MLEVYERLGPHCEENIDSRVVLSHDQRDRGRLRTTTSAGDEVRIFLDRGTPLLVGEYLRTQCGKHLLIEGAFEDVVGASCANWNTFSRACFHLGNRHVKVQIAERSLYILPDHVLEEMLIMLGLTLHREQRIFIPEAGAYSHASLLHH